MNIIAARAGPISRSQSARRNPRTKGVAEAFAILTFSKGRKSQKALLIFRES